MRSSLKCTLSVLTLSALACGGPLSNPDSGSLPGETGDDGPIQVDSQICQDYLDCLAATDPGSLSTKEGEYGLLGDCWQGGEVTRCETVCADEHQALFEENPHEAACGEADLCPKGGRWDMKSEPNDSGCYLPPLEFQLTCTETDTNWSLTLEYDGERLWSCEGAGSTGDFDCDAERFNATLEGSFEGLYEEAVGTFSIHDNDGCDGTGDMLLERSF